MALFFIYPLPLISPCPVSFRNKKTKRKNYEKEKGTERNRRDRPIGGGMARSTRKESPSAYPSTALSYKFLSCAVSVERKQKERREREVREER